MDVYSFPLTIYYFISLIFLAIKKTLRHEIQINIIVIYHWKKTLFISTLLQHVISWLDIWTPYLRTRSAPFIFMYFLYHTHTNTIHPCIAYNWMFFGSLTTFSFPLNCCVCFYTSELITRSLSDTKYSGMSVFKGVHICVSCHLHTFFTCMKD